MIYKTCSTSINRKEFDKQNLQICGALLINSRNLVLDNQRVISEQAIYVYICRKEKHLEVYREKKS